VTTSFEGKKAEGDGPERVLGQFHVVPPPGRRTRLPELAVGAALMVGFALAAVLWHMSSTQREPALALAQAVRRGEAIEAADLRVVYLASDDPIARLGRGDAGAVVGRIAVADMPAGTLLTRASVAPWAAVGPGEGVVGLALDPGQVPAPELVAGDVVNVIAGPADGAGEEQAEGGEVVLLASRAQVFAVEDLGTQGRKFVSLKLREANANSVAAAAQAGPVRLVLVGRGA
jgi:hypothetical protein